MSNHDRRAAARRRAWGRGPAILRFEPLEGRQLLSADVPMPDLVPAKFDTVHTANWNDLVHATGTIANQGTATTIVPTSVDVYASTTPTINASSVLMGEIQVPAGLAPGASYNFDQVVALPSTPIPGSAPSVPIYLAMRADGGNTVAELSEANNEGHGLGVDASIMTIASRMPADLVGTSFGVTAINQSTAGALSWGDTISVTAQVKNKGQGDAPPTRARVVLTPLGATPGAYSDVTIASIDVPAVPAFQSVNLVKAIDLAAIKPATLGNATQFTLSLVQDGDFLTQPIYPQVADQGNGIDQVTVAIGPGPQANAPTTALANLAPASVAVSSTTLNWGQSFDVGTVIQNVGRGDAGDFTVRFVATGVAGDLSHGFFLGDAVVKGGLSAGAATSILTTVRLPSKLPHGTKVSDVTYVRVYAIVDPEDVIDQALRTNNMASSSPILLSVVGADGKSTVPTYPANAYDSAALAVQKAKSDKKDQIAAQQAARQAAQQAARQAAQQAARQAIQDARQAIQDAKNAKNNPPKIGTPQPAGSSSNKPPSVQIKVAQKQLAAAKHRLKILAGSSKASAKLIAKFAANPSNTPA